MTPTVDHPLPEAIGRYRLLGRLGAGGMGTVYRAHDPHLDRIVALKLPRLDGPAEQRASRAQRFQREARAAARILHPNVCPIFDVGEHDGAAFVVMAYIDGPSLAQVLEQRGRFDDIREVVVLARQVLDGLAEVHANGIIHRDVKPGNILLDAAGRAILTDFGLARPEEAGAGLTSDGAVIGTPAYMAPEQAAGRADQVGPWTDLYAVGVVLYHTLTGRLPFEGPAVAVLGAVLRDEPPPPRRFRPDLDPALERVVLRAMSKEPRSRFADAREFGAALAGLSIPVAPAPSATLVLAKPLQAIEEPPPRRVDWLIRRARWLLGAAFVAFGGTILGLMALSLVTDETESMPYRLLPAFGISLVFAMPGILLGPCLWHLAELSQVPQGLWHAAKSGAVGAVRAAARRGSSLDLPDDLGETALMHAASGGHTEVVKILLLHGVDTNAVSSLGQTTAEIARARGNGDILALLEKETRPPRPAGATPGAQPSARRWMVGSVSFGALLVVGYHWAYDPWPTRISFQEMDQLVRAKSVKSIEIRNRAVVGEVKLPGVHPHLSRGRFCAGVPDGYSITKEGLTNLDTMIRVNHVSAGKFTRQPSAWSIILILGIPALIAAFVGWPLGSAYWFPILRPWRR